MSQYTVYAADFCGQFASRYADDFAGALLAYTELRAKYHTRNIPTTFDMYGPCPDYDHDGLSDDEREAFEAHRDEVDARYPMRTVPTWHGYGTGSQLEPGVCAECDQGRDS